MASLPILAAGEFGFTTDTKRLYIGNGVSNTMYYNSTDLPLRIMSATLTDGNTSVPKIALNENFNTGSVVNVNPVDLRCSIPTPASDRMGGGSTLFGYQTRATGTYSFVANQYNLSSGAGASSFGNGTTAIGENSLSSGVSTTADVYCQVAFGHYNVASTGSTSSLSMTQNALVIGNGSGPGSRSNCFRVRYDGNVFGLAAFNSSGADYAEYFEWSDGNATKQDRVGRFVAISSGDKIALANNLSKTEILGVVSATASVKGNSASANWHGMYLKDNYGRTIYETKIEGGVQIKTPKINPEYNPSESYLSREERPEWDPIGLLGRLRVRDDGTCAVGKHCICGADGVATTGTNGFKVLKRISQNVIEILLK